MTDREKAIVMAYTGVVMLTGDRLWTFYGYVQEKIGRPVYTHEFLALWEQIKEASKEDFIALCEAVEEEPEKEPPQTAPRPMRCPINGAPCNECKPGAPCAEDAADCNHSPFPVGMSQAEYYGITKEE